MRHPFNDRLDPTTNAFMAGCSCGIIFCLGVVLGGMAVGWLVWG